MHLLVLGDPAPVDQYRCRLLLSIFAGALQRCHDQKSVLAIVQARADQHLLAVVQHARRVDTAVVEVGDGVRVDARRQRQRRLDQPVLQACDQVRLPAQSLHLPGSEREGGDGDER